MRGEICGLDPHHAQFEESEPSPDGDSDGDATGWPVWYQRPASAVSAVVGGGGCDQAGHGDHKDAKPEHGMDFNAPSGVLLSGVTSSPESEHGGAETMH